jgi:hypothetical protein
MKELKNLLLHEIRNGNLLNLSAQIVIRQIQKGDINEIETSYKKFAENLEYNINQAIKTYLKNETKNNKNTN